VRAAGSGWLARLQACEYAGRLNLERRAQSALGAITTLPGAATLWRRSALQAMGGFSDRTLAEDTDLTLTAQHKGLQLGFADLAVARTIVPHSLGALMRQRGRWFWGNAACALIHWPGTDSSGRFRIIAAMFALLNLGSAPALLVSCLLAVGLLEEGRIAFVSLLGLLTVLAGVLCAAVGFHKDRQPLPPPWVVLPSLVLAPIITTAATVRVCGRRLTGPIGWGREPLQRLSEWSAADRRWPGVAKRTGSRLDLS
jgi:cellulose synthase/poly-beta-1,6-N-acetylglucosamine synthase-like glycosyltransferase